MKIKVESVEVYAMLNYLRDKAFDLVEDDESWESCRQEYLDEANQDKGIILTKDEMDLIFKKFGVK